MLFGKGSPYVQNADAEGILRLRVSINVSAGAPLAVPELEETVRDSGWQRVVWMLQDIKGLIDNTPPECKLTSPTFVMPVSRNDVQYYCIFIIHSDAGASLLSSKGELLHRPRLKSDRHAPPISKYLGCRNWFARACGMEKAGGKVIRRHQENRDFRPESVS